MFCDRRAYWFVGINDKYSKYSAYYFDLNKLLKKERELEQILHLVWQNVCFLEKLFG